MSFDRQSSSTSSQQSADDRVVLAAACGGYMAPSAAGDLVVTSGMGVMGSTGDYKDH